MNDFSVSMALIDFIPVICFGIAAIILQRDLYNKMSKGAFALFAAGTIDVITAGFLKATYKLLYAAGVCDFKVLSTLFFPLQAIGFLLAGLGLVALITHPQKAMYAVAPVPFSGTMIFVLFMVLGLGAMDFALARLASKMGKKKTIILFVVSFVACLCMGYLSSKDFTQAFMNWVAQGINVVGQGTLLLATISLHKAGLKDLSL